MPELQAEHVDIEPKKREEFPDTETFMKVLLKANFESSRYIESVDLIEKQREIISHLPKDFIIEMAMHLRNETERQKKRRPGDEVGSFGIILGELFERFVEIEDDLYKLIPDREGEVAETEEDKRIAIKILDVMQNPDEYDLHGIELSNPDVLKIKLVNGSYEIREDVEVKTNIDARTKRQLGQNGFKQSFGKIMSKLNSSDFSNNPKLSEFGIHGKKISISPKFFQNLVILRDQSITADGIKRDGVRGQENMTDWQVNEFIKQLRNPEEIGLIRASFGKKELVGLTHLIMEQIFKDGLS